MIDLRTLLLVLATASVPALGLGCDDARRNCEDGTGPDGRCLFAYELECANDHDDDGDGLVDCADAECKEDPACPVTPPEVCDNLVDDDADGQIDCDDDECYGIGLDELPRFPGCDCVVAYPPATGLDTCVADGGACYHGLRSGVQTANSGCVPLADVSYRLHLNGSGDLAICATETCELWVDASDLTASPQPAEALTGMTFEADGSAFCGTWETNFGCDVTFEVDGPGTFGLQVLHGMDSLFACAGAVPSTGSSNLLCADPVHGGSFEIGFEAVLN